MPTLDASLEAQTIANIGHIYYAPVGTNFPDLSKFNFTGQDISGWKWLGDTSAENLPEFEADGDDDGGKRVWDRKNTRSGSAKITGTINSVAPTKEIFDAINRGGGSDVTGYVFTDRTSGSSHALLIVVEDGSYVTGLGFYNTTLSISLPKYDLENYTEVPVKVTAEADSQGRIYKNFYPLRRSAPAPTGRN